MYLVQSSQHFFDRKPPWKSLEDPITKVNGFQIEFVLDFHEMNPLMLSVANKYL